MSGEVRWVTAFLDTAPERAEQTESFWSRVTGYHLSPRRGARGESASLLPADGDPHLKVQASFPSPDGRYPDASRDLIGQGAANLASGVNRRSHCSKQPTHRAASSPRRDRGLPLDPEPAVRRGPVPGASHRRL